MKMTISVTDLMMCFWNLSSIWMTIMLGLSESYQNELIYTVPCKEGWYLYGEKCYGVMGVENKLTWKQASDTCALENGTLATIYSNDLQEFVTAFAQLNVKSTLWIGLNDRENESLFVWDDGSPLNYTFWDTNQPSGGITGINKFDDDCVEMRVIGQSLGKWNDYDCSTKMSFLCQADKDTSLSNPDPRFCFEDENGGWKYLNSCYHIVQEKMAWEEAEFYCQEVYRGHLVTILDFEAQVYISHILSNQSIDFWIGIQIKNQNMQRWSSGWAAAFTRWDDEHKDFLDGTCALVTPKKTWSSSPCFKQLPFVCETSKDPSPPMLKQAPSGWICPPSSNDWIDLGGDTCYIFELDKSLDWLEANFYCHKKGGSLASIHSDIETKILEPHVIKTKEVFIGLHRNQYTEKMLFEWADGSDLDYVNWNDHEPSNVNERCGELWTDSMKWNDIYCNRKRGFICSARKVPPKSNQENQTQCETIASASRNSAKQDVSKFKRGISMKTVIGITVLILVLSFFIGIAIRYYVKSYIPDFAMCHYVKSYIPGFRSKKNTTSVENLDNGTVQFCKLQHSEI